VPYSLPIEKDEKIKLSRWLEKSIPHYFPNKGALIEIIDIIAEATIPIRGLLERGITSREIEERMNIEKPKANSKNIYDEIQIHEDILTHSIILKALQEREANFSFIASEEAEPALGEGKFGITIDPVDGSSNVAVNRTVGTIVGIYNENGHIICSFYVLYGIFTNLVLAINGIAAEFILDTSPYSMTFYHYIFYELKILPNKESGGIRCLGGDANNWSGKSKTFEQILIENHVKDRYSGSFVGDLHAIIHYGGVYAYFPCPKPKIRVFYEWLPLAFIIKALGGEFLAIGDRNDLEKIQTLEDFEPLTKENVQRIHAIECGGLVGSIKLVDIFRSL
jgi:fructose-1,6-bisphosphatase I